MGVGPPVEVRDHPARAGRPARPGNTICQRAAGEQRRRPGPLARSGRRPRSAVSVARPRGACGASRRAYRRLPVRPVAHTVRGGRT